MLRLLCLPIMLLPTMVVAQVAPTPTAVVAAKQEGEKLLCKRVQFSGSIIPGKKVCLTKAENEQIRRAAREEAERMSERKGHYSGYYDGY